MTASGPGPDHPGEHRFPPVVALVVAVGLYVGLPTDLVFGVRFAVPTLELVLLVPVVAINPRRMTRETRLSRILGLALILVIAAANLTSLALLVHQLVTKTSTGGPTLLLAALQVWLTNVIVFGLVYWEMDRGGPVRRTQSMRTDLPPADFRFTQDEDGDAVNEVARRSSEKAGWTPSYVDYLYTSLTNSSAFSPTDTMPLTHRAKGLMAVQATAALMVSLLVVAKAVASLQ